MKIGIESICEILWPISSLRVFFFKEEIELNEKYYIHKEEDETRNKKIQKKNRSAMHFDMKTVTHKFAWFLLQWYTAAQNECYSNKRFAKV